MLDNFKGLINATPTTIKVIQIQTPIEIKIIDNKDNDCEIDEDYIEKNKMDFVFEMKKNKK